MHRLTAVAGEEKHLCCYRYPAAPGKPWHCYRSEKYNEESTDKKLEDRLLDLLTPSTTVEELKNIARNPGSWYCPYLRLKQKQLDEREWLVDGEVHNGAHFVLCVFTNNSRARSEGGDQYRANRHLSKDKRNNGKGGTNKGKGGKDKGTRSRGEGGDWGQQQRYWCWQKTGWSWTDGWDST